MPGSEYHRISLFPRLIRDISFPHGTINALNEPAYVTVNLKGARPDMFFITRIKPTSASQLGISPILAYCVTDDVIRVAFIGGETSGGDAPTTIIAL